MNLHETIPDRSSKRVPVRFVAGLMFPVLLALFVRFALAAVNPPQAGPLPTPFPEARYQPMSVKSPFAVATATGATAAPTPGFAAQLYVNGVAHVGNVDFVVIKSRDPEKKNTIFAEVGKTTDEGIQIERINWSSEMGKSTVEVSKNGERATLVFDQMAMNENGGVAAAAPGQPTMMTGPRPINFPLLRNGAAPRQAGIQFNRGQQIQEMQQPGAAPVTPPLLNAGTLRRPIIRSP